MVVKKSHFFLLLFGMAHVHPSPMTFKYSHLQVTGNYTVSIGMTMDDTIKLCFAFAPRIKSLEVRSLFISMPNWLRT